MTSDLDNKIICGDCILVMQDIPSDYVDAIITDPPYGLAFMGKEWDKFGKNLQRYQEWTRRWAVEALRVLKPGGHLLSFSSSRTYHRLTCGIEDAGFEIRDCIMWVYGSGFPKSLDISKAIDKKRGIWRGRAQSIISNNISMKGPNYTRTDKGVPVTEEAKQWEGWGTALKPAFEPIVVARKPLSEDNVVNNILKWGTGGLNINDSRIDSYADSFLDKGRKPGGTSLNWSKTPRKERFYDGSKGRFPSQLILECRCNIIKDKENDKEVIRLDSGNQGVLGLLVSPQSDRNEEYRDTIHTDPTCPCYLLDLQSGRNESRKARVSKGSEGVSRFFKQIKSESRFFYCPKASTSEKNRGLEGYILKSDTPEEIRREIEKIFNFSLMKFMIISKEQYNNLPEKYKTYFKEFRNDHPTVKSVSLMEYLVKLVTPPGGLVLDPFAGSGSTLIACRNLGFRFIGIEREEEYVKIAEKRVWNTGGIDASEDNTTGISRSL